MKKLFVFSLIAVGAFSTYAQQSMLPKSDEEQVKAVITELFDGYRIGDSLRVKNTFTEMAVLQTAYFDKAANSQLSDPMPISTFTSYIGGGLSKVHDERIWDMKIQIDNNLASAWTRYAFYLDGTFLHCGAENFLLIKKNGSWKIFHLVDTRQQTGCKVPESVKNQ